MARAKVARPVLPLVSDVHEVRDNIEAYHKALEGLDPDQYGERAIARMIPYVRAWYAVRDARASHFRPFQIYWLLRDYSRSIRTI